eukprot:CAMPEP_0177701514 /NCGR_PEP_ID=MMETSP0484_2-20121128/6649_1 /TAXON_ID=354590 /ORGANISM="Rhodomonas lens, Strain RHODO" /LENGTH=61 /DNA_ID=CAMNT_0019212747 /DNA_START=107 /DNA_END=292 /DNA_ORIENTATION=-
MVGINAFQHRVDLLHRQIVSSQVAQRRSELRSVNGPALVQVILAEQLPESVVAPGIRQRSQ